MKKFVIVSRNEKNSVFGVTGLVWYWLGFRFAPTEMDEKEIIKLIEYGHEFYTPKYKKWCLFGCFQPVTVVKKHIKSVANDTTVDNIGNLPYITK
jgi:uncharacterized radical SAM superfamily protein